MTLPEPILTFWMASLRLHADLRQTDWGAVVTDPRYPLVYEANHASVLKPAPDLTLGDIRSELLPALKEARATHEHVEIMDADDRNPALRELLAAPGDHSPDVLMIYEGKDTPGGGRASSDLSDGIRVEEVARPTGSFWETYRLVPNEYGEALPDDVLDQMLNRVEEVFLPAGERFFLGRVGGVDAGVASALTLKGVAYIDNVVTWPAFRGRGVAGAMVRRTVEASLQAGAELVFLLAEESGSARRLYEHLGFRVHRRCYGFTRPLHEVG
jgi:ribosomal protein S18 acetylase RimI-like enzyme